jgi:purine-binding chemotaxis protein CheW
MKPSPGERKAIDWRQVRRRLDRAIASTEGSGRLPPDRARAVLEERARALARPPAATVGAGEVLELILFSFGDERAAMETRHVREVVRIGDCTPVPGAPDFLLGIVNLRGEVLAVFDLRRLFGVPAREPGSLSRLLVLGGDRAEFGLIADAVHEVRTLWLDALREPPGAIAGRELIRGVTADALVVLDGAALLLDRRLFIDGGEGPGF